MVVIWDLLDLKQAVSAVTEGIPLFLAGLNLDPVVIEAVIGVERRRDVAFLQSRERGL